MAVVTIPDGLLFGADCSWGQLRFDQVDESEADGSSDVRVRGRPRWTCSLVPPQRLKQGVEAQKWESMLLALKGKTNVLAAYDPVRPLPAGGAWAGAVTVAPRKVKKISGAEAWDSRCCSDRAYSSGAALRFRAATSSDSICVGLTSDPLASAGKDTLDFAFLLAFGGVYASESGTIIGPLGTHSGLTELLITDDGTNIRYYIDAALVRTTASTGSPQYFSSSVLSVGSAFTDIYFGASIYDYHVPFSVSLSNAGITANFDIDKVTLFASSETVGRSFSAGDKVQMGEGFGSSELVRIVTSTGLDADKFVTVVFEPSARLFYGAGAPVTTAKPVAYFGSTSDQVRWTYDGTGLLVRGYSFDGRERWI